ncbi:pentatricopeptide repeat-containing protein [Cinnamomum micranthum f. kanehirae]|uniref:Pentatricopeptide repeat-containing protein n=1 Tax=Cinnamomum micranthum f. kanehirae TaxID=337451 RepID=A0A443PE81_9MAGN|nr:pentatricopeptide repeat-containing protein [Cinnamomum micranthum f. kanehirae]
MLTRHSATRLLRNVAVNRLQKRLAGNSNTSPQNLAVRLSKPGPNKNNEPSSPTDAEIVKWNKAISDHMRNGRCEAALHLFDTMPSRTTVSWNAMISGYLNSDRFDLARRFFDEMPDRNLVSWNVMINGYVRNYDLFAARRLFDEMPERDVVSWNTMISGYARNGFVDEAREIFDRMPVKKSVSWNVMISGYVRNHNMQAARCLFDKMPERDVVSWNTMISGYAQNGYVDEARKIFYQMPVKNSISWNGILSGYIQNGRMEAARHLFESNSNWDTVSWNALMAGYVHRKRLVDARMLFNRMPGRDLVSWNTMISGYAQNGNLSEAQKLFEESPTRDVFTWTAIVSGYVQNGMLVEARRVFDEMPVKNSVSWNAMIAGYSQCRMMDEAKELFEAMPCRNISSWNTMITGYAQNGEIDHARQLFNEMPKHDSISWAAMLAGYAQGGYSEGALHLFIQMNRDGERMNRSAFTCALSTCADIAALECGKQLHGRLVQAGYEMGCFVGNALLAMYCKCGSIDQAYDAFKEMPEKDLVTWNTMIDGYAKHGFGKKALVIFESMRMTSIKPDDVTMVGVLSACSHAGLVDKGIDYFYSMNRDYGITAKAQHYTCMIDLLGRAGHLEDAQALMKSMPFEPDATMWGALLGASRIHGNTKLGEKAAERIFEMEPDNSGMYVLLSNLYAAAGRWSDVGKMRVTMRERGVKKVPGFSWIEVQNKVHTFSVGDSVHPEREKIYAFLEELDLEIKKLGYVSATKMILHDVEEEEKEHMLKYHSEKLAVAFGILNVPRGRPIRVIKNLRVCEDCHNAIKHISKIVNRSIILRDSNRFHHFDGGGCSCGDYW